MKERQSRVDRVGYDAHHDTLSWCILINDDVIWCLVLRVCECAGRCESGDYIGTGSREMVV